MFIKEVQERLRQIKNENISQGDIARAINTSRSNVSQLFSKNSQLSADKLEKIEQFFGVSLHRESCNKSQQIIKIPVFQNKSLDKIHKYICISDIFTTKISSPLAFVVNSNSMSPYIDKGDMAIFDKDFKNLEDGKIYLIKYRGCTYIKRILNNFNEIILKSDNADYKDVVIPDYKLEEIEVIARFHSLLRSGG